MTDRWLASRLAEGSRLHAPVEGRPCSRHPEQGAIGRCDRCGQPFCGRCLCRVGQWRVCAACLEQLRRERRGSSWRVRLGRGWREAAAALAIGALMLGICVIIGRGVGDAASDAGLAGTAKELGGKVLLAQQMGAHQAAPARLRLQVPLEASPPPAQIVLDGTGFQPDELVRVTGTLYGQTGGGHVGSVALAPAHALPDGEVRATSSGDLGTVVLTVPDNARFTGGYYVRVLATGSKGSRAQFEELAGGVSAAAP